MEKNWVQHSLTEWRLQTPHEEGPIIHGKVLIKEGGPSKHTIYVATIKNVHKEEYGFSIKFHLKSPHNAFSAAQIDVSETVRALERLDHSHETPERDMIQSLRYLVDLVNRARGHH